MSKDVKQVIVIWSLVFVAGIGVTGYITFTISQMTVG